MRSHNASGPVSLLFAGLLAAPALAQGTIVDVAIDPDVPSSTRVLATDKGVYFTELGGTPQASAYSSAAGVTGVRRVSVDPFDLDLWVSARPTPGGFMEVALIDNGGSSFGVEVFPAGGEPTDLNHSPDIPGRVVMAHKTLDSSTAGVFFSDDGGKTWSPSAGTLGVPYSQIEFDSFAAGRVLGFTNDGSISVSFDSGASWILPEPSLGSGVTSLISSRQEPGLWYAATVDMRIWRSEDSGTSWVELGMQGFCVEENDAVPDMIWVGSTIGRLQFSPDRGDSWSEPENVTPFYSLAPILDIVYDRQTSTVVCAGVSGGVQTAFAEVEPAVAGIGGATKGSGGVRPRIYLGGVVRSGNPAFSFKGDSCVGDGFVYQFVSRDLVAIPLFGGTSFIGSQLVTSFVAFAQAPVGQAGTPGAGAFEVPAPLPVNPAIQGTMFITQFAVVDPGALDPSMVVLSRGLRLFGQG